MSRRKFLKNTLRTAAVASVAAYSFDTVHSAGVFENILPTIPLGNTQITRLIAGWNPIAGISHAVPNLSKHMLQYFTENRVNDFLAKCEMSGINAWVCGYGARATAACNYLKRRDSRMKILTLHSDSLQQTRGSRAVSIANAINTTGCFAIIHQAISTDALLRGGKKQQLKDYVKNVRDQGILVGIASHCPDHVKMISDEDWENDFFMTSFYYLTQPDYEQNNRVGKVVLGEPFFVSDPQDMVQVISQTSKPCLASTILGSGRLCYSSASVDAAFQFAFEKIKRTDAVVVGMYPAFFDEVQDNIRLTLKYGRLPDQSSKPKET